MLQLSKLVSVPSRFLSAAKKEIPKLNYEQLQKLMNSNKKVLIVDVREADELTAEGKIPVSVHVPRKISKPF